MSDTQNRASQFNHALAARLHELRKEAALSQSALAAELGVDQAAISRGETGDRKLSVGEALVWLEALGLTPEEVGSTISALWETQGSRSETFWRKYE